MKIATKILFIIVMLGLCFRLSGITWGLPNADHPYSYHPDEARQINAVAQMNPFVLDFNPDDFIYPSLNYYTTALGLGIAKILGFVELVPDISFYTQNPEQLAKLFIVGRIISMLFSLATIIVVYHLGKELWNEQAGLISALFFAVIPISVVESHYLTNDSQMLFWMSLALLYSIKAIKNENTLDYVLTGVFAGLATGTKYPGILVLSGITMVCFMQLMTKATWEKNIFEHPKTRNWAMMFLTTIMVFFLTTPYALLDFNNFNQDIHTVLTENKQEGIYGYNLAEDGPWPYYPVFYQLFVMIPFVVTISLMFFLVFGLFMILFLNDPDEDKTKIYYEKYVLLIFLFVYFFVFSTAKTAFPRYFLPIAMIACLIVGYWFKTHKFDITPKNLPGTTIGLALIFSVAMTTTGFVSHFHNDTIDQTHDWIQENVPSYSNLAVTLWSPLRYSPLIDPQAYNNTHSQDEVILKKREQNAPLVQVVGTKTYETYTLFNPSEEWLKWVKPDYIITSSLETSSHKRKQFQNQKQKDQARFYELLENSTDYEKVKVFKKYYFGKETYVDLDPMFESYYASPTIIVYKRKVIETI